MYQKRWSFGLGTIFSLIVVYFIFLYSKEKGWTLLALASKWYLIIVGGLLALSLLIILSIILFAIVLALIAALKIKGLRRKYKKRNLNYVDVDYRIKEEK